MVKSSASDATDSTLGFYFQAVYGLVVLFDAGDNEGVSIETADDVELVGPNPTLLQIKHSLNTPPALTEKNDGFWHTFAIWLSQPECWSQHFVFVTCAAIPESHALRELTIPDGKRKGVKALLETEAQRVISERSYALANNTKLPYEDRAPGCDAFLALSEDERTNFLARVTIIHKSFGLSGIDHEIDQRLAMLPRTQRACIRERLIEWWSRRIALGMLKKESRVVSKEELARRINELVIELSDDDLPNDFSCALPEMLEPSPDGFLERQIALVQGGTSRLRRAIVARWRARNQRDRWINENLAIAAELHQWDDRLIEQWSDRHGPMCDDVAGKSEDEKASKGRQLLDWSHNDASKDIPPVRTKWHEPFLTQGTYQQLADEIRVGWHPEFRQLLASVKQKGGNATSTLAKRRRK
jgi:hypothetical protein